MSITRDEWLAELQRVMTAHDADGMTMREIAACLGVGIRAASERFRAHPELIECVGRKSILSMDGRTIYAPAYRLRKA